MVVGNVVEGERRLAEVVGMRPVAGERTAVVVEDRIERGLFGRVVWRKEEEEEEEEERIAAGLWRISHVLTKSRVQALQPFAPFPPGGAERGQQTTMHKGRSSYEDSIETSRYGKALKAVYKLVKNRNSKKMEAVSC